MVLAVLAVLFIIFVIGLIKAFFFFRMIQGQISGAIQQASGTSVSQEDPKKALQNFINERVRNAGAALSSVAAQSSLSEPAAIPSHADDAAPVDDKHLSLPAEFPSDVPVMDNMTITESSFGHMGKNTVFNISWTTHATIEDVMTFEEQALKDKGWEITLSGISSSEGGALSFNKTSGTVMREGSFSVKSGENGLTTVDSVIISVVDTSS